MKTRSVYEAVQCLNETELHCSFVAGQMYKSLESSVLILADHPSEHTYKHFQKCLWKTYGWIEGKNDCAKPMSKKTEGQIRILLSRLESFFA